MHLKKTAVIAATLIGSGLLAACDGTDLNPGAPVIINVGGSTGGSTGGTVPTGNPLRGSLGSGAGTTFAGTGLVDPFSIATYFQLAGFGNSTSVAGRIDNTGYPVAGTTGLAANFDAPAVWPPVTATDATSLPVPATVVSTSYIGAFDPTVARANAWTAGWTVRVNGNDDVWRFFGDATGTALSGVAAPVSSGTCPAGTTFVGPFSSLIGPLSQDETSLFSGTVASGDYDVCQLPARYASAGTLTLTNDNVYVIENDSFPGTVIGNGDRLRTDPAYAETPSVLNIEPGTLVYASGRSALVISRGAQIQANGTAAAPIVLTSRNQLQNRFDGSSATPTDAIPGGWAGLALLGRAPDSQCQGTGLPENFAACDVLIEGNVGRYGGNSPNDSSGSLRYVIVRSTGSIIAEGNELQGITAGGVGRGTVMDYIDIHRSNDDGIEFFGGSVFGTHMVITGAADDSIDGDNGWTGGVQHALVIQENFESNSGFELDGRFARTPISFPLFANITVLGPQARGSQTGDRLGMLTREGIRFSFNNTIVTGDFPLGCVDIDDNDGNGVVENTFSRVNEAGGSASTGGPHLVYRNMIIDCSTSAPAPAAAINFRQNDENPPAL